MRARGAARARLLGAAGLMALIGGCATLPTIPEGTCGNAIVEKGEDCERFTNDPSVKCGAPGDASGACRFTCATADAKCPAGFGCGSDGICRAASGAFESPMSMAVQANAVGTGDFDGDGRSEILARSARGITVLSTDATRSSFEVKNSIGANNVSFPAIGKFSEAFSDLAIIRAGGFVSLWRGQAQGPLQPSFYAAFPATGDQLRLIAGEVLPRSAGAAYQGLEVLVAHNYATAGPHLSYLIPPGIDVRPVLKLPRAPSELVGSVAGRFIEAFPCDSVVIAYPDDAQIALVPLCRKRGNDFVGNDLYDLASGALALEPKHVAPATVALPSGVTVGARGVLIVDFDKDGHLDLLIHGKQKSDNTSVNLIAYGVGDGTFDAVPWRPPALPPLPMPNNTASVAGNLGCGKFGDDFPFAIGHLTAGDDVPDAAMARGVCYRTATSARFLDLSAQVEDAAFGDVNASGLPDAVVATRNALEVLRSTGEYGYRFTEPRSGAGRLAIGDVDGDLVQDVVFRETLDGRETLSLMYGRPFSGPAEPVSLGVLSEVTQVLVGPVNSFGSDVDDVADIGVANRRGATGDPNPFEVALIRGSTTRELEAPFAIGSLTDGTRDSAARLLVGGRFTAGDLDSLVAVTTQPDGAPGTAEVWFVPFGKGGTVDTTRMVHATDVLKGTFTWSAARGVAVDLDRSPVSAVPAAPSGTPEVVIVAPSQGINQPNRLWVVRLREAEGLSVSALDLPEAGANTVGRPFELVSGDFDRDGVADVAVRSQHENEYRVYVYFGDGVGGLVATPTRVPTEGNDSAVGVLKKLGEAQLIVSVKRREEANLATRDLRAVVFADRVASLGEVLVEVSSDEQRSTISAEGVRGISMADVDDDGVEDLVMASGAAVTVYFGRPVNR